MSTNPLQLDLGDKRLDCRCNQLIDQLTRKPSASIPEACGSWKDTKAAYRFLTNEAVNPQKILAAHTQAIKSKLQQETGIILVPQDTTDCDYTSHPQTKGLGYLQGQRLFGIKVHTALAVSEYGTPLGILSQKQWVRPLSECEKRHHRVKEPLEQRESYRWITTLQEAAKIIPADKLAVVIGDREAAMYELFTTPRQSNIQLLVRAKDRDVQNGQGKLFTTMEGVKPAGTLKLRLQRIPNRPAREVDLMVRFALVSIVSSDQTQACSLWCVMLKEQPSPTTTEKPIFWVLLTTLPITTFAKAVKLAQWYTHRWVIERFHYCLKSGCKIEELQLQEESRLERAGVVYSLVAWKLLWLTYEAREHPRESCERVLSSEEWQILVKLTETKQPLHTPPTMREAVRMIAQLGGFLARKSDHDPGVKTLWRGLRRFTDMLTAWRIFKVLD